MKVKEIRRYLTDASFDIRAADTLIKKGIPETRDEREAWIDNHSPELGSLLDVFQADSRHGMVVILQGMDTAGKDGTVRRIFRNVNFTPRICAFKSPTPDEAAHDYLWRIHKEMPKRGEMVIFNRSHYEDVLITRVRHWIDDAETTHRLRQINDFERMLAENHITVLKLFLHISKEEQRLRIQRRLDNKEKHWKFNLSDLEDRKLWDSFQEQYQAVIRATTTGYAPWYCVPSDSKSSRNIIIMKILIAHLRSLKLRYPTVDDANWPTVVE